jgi:hypothetical protein
MSKLPVPTEAQEGDMLVAYLRTRGLRFTHIANETGGTPEARRRAIRVKRQGVSKGFPDYLIIVGRSLIAIELKRQRGSAISQEQKDWIAALNEVDNVQAFICKGAQEAIDIVEKYNGPPRHQGKRQGEPAF